MLDYDIVTPEIVRLQIQSLEAVIRAEDAAIDSYLETLSMMMKAPVFKEADMAWIKGLLERAQHSKEKHLAEIEVKKSVKSFL